jgi:hypothetical protein
MKDLLLVLLISLSFHCIGQNRFHISGRIIAAHAIDTSDFKTNIVELVNASGNLCAETIDSLGYFEIYGIEPGTYHLRFKGPLNREIDSVIWISNQSIENVVLVIKAHCRTYTEEAAKNDIISNEIKLQLGPGYIRSFNSYDRTFQKKYHLSYTGTGCLRFDAHSCLASYNKIIFQLLDARHGQKWRKKVRRDVIGLND